MARIQQAYSLYPFNSIESTISSNNYVSDSPLVNEADVIPSFASRHETESSGVDWDNDYVLDENILHIFDNQNLMESCLKYLF